VQEEVTKSTAEGISRVQEYMIREGYLNHDESAHYELAKYLFDRKNGSDIGLLMIGKTGTGKTMFLNKFAFPEGMKKPILVDELMLRYMQDPEFFRESLQICGGTIVPRFYCDVAIDDLGQEPSLNHYGTKMELMEQAIAIRYNSFLKAGSRTYISTNLTIDEIGARYGQRTVSRLMEMCTIINIDCPDQRII
jgi:DNA replication protein DnaC